MSVILSKEWKPVPAPDAPVAIVADVPKPTVRDLLKTRRFDYGNPPPDEPVVYSIAGTPIAHAGNITTIEAAQKAGKSAIVSAAVASTFCRPSADCLGWQSANPKGLAVLHFDTEQSMGDHHRLMARAVQTAGATEPPAWLISHCLTGFSCAEMKGAMLAMIEDCGAQFGGIHSLLLDGLADPIADVNDPEESFAFVAWLQGLAIAGLFPVIGILHLNPNGEKSRGHLGSQLGRKSEHILRVERDGDISTVKTQWSRRAPIPRESQPAFTWSTEANRHVSTANRATGQSHAKRAELEELAAECFRDSAGIGLTWEALHQRIEAAEGLKRGGARKKFARLRDAGIIYQSTDKWYRR